MNLIENAHQMPTGMLLDEARRQFAAAECVRNDWQQSLYERGGWFMLLAHADRTYIAPYCAKLAGPCPDGCEGVKVACGRPGELHGDCWRVKQPSTSGVKGPEHG